MNKEVHGESRVLEKTLDSLDVRRKAPTGVFVLLLILYFASAVIVSLTAGSKSVVMLGDYPVNVYTFAGVLSSVSNLCIVLMVIFCGMPGFVVSVVVLLLQIPMMLMGIIFKGNLTSLPGIFGNLLTIIVIFVIHVSKMKVEKYQHRLREQATTDLLTGLPNAFAITELINELIKRNRSFAAVTIDINNFKSINDTMGFDVGNKVLIEIASRWRKLADEGLTGTTDFISRMSGDEFVLVIRDHKSDEDVLKSIKQYRGLLRDKICVDGYEIFADASFGYAIYPDDAPERDILVTASVAAMKEIKRINNSEHILRFSSDLLKNQNTLEEDNKVRYALEHDLVGFQLQPQFDMEHKLRGFEALARMKDADGNPVSPGEFIPSAERTGLIDTLDLTVYRKSALLFGELIRKTGADITLSINASVKHLMKSNFADEIRYIMKISGIPAAQLEIEITESILIESAEKAAECLNELEEMGLRIAIDDFGTGYSSLSYLNSFPSDVLKIDKSFIDRMNESDSSQKYVEAIITLAHVLDLEVIAEGVEEQAQLETLRGIHCDIIQGFLWGRPLSQEDAKALVEKEFSA